MMVGLNVKTKMRHSLVTRVPIRVQRLLAFCAFLTVSYIIVSFLMRYKHPSGTPGLAKEHCHMPQMDVNDSEVTKFLKYQPPFECGPEDWVKIEGSVAKITDSAKKLYGNIECQFTDVVRSSDFSSFPGVTTTTHTEYNLENSDFVRVSCRSEDGHKWESRMAGVRQDDEIQNRATWNSLPPEALRLNVLIFGMDSLSRLTFIRKLPKAYAKLVSLNSIVLEGYNIVGDGTPQALIPILTGKTEPELPETRRRMFLKANYVNVYPFIWNDFHKHGYVTAYMEDVPQVGIFTYRLKGFDAEPTDHYMRTYYVDAENDFPNHRQYCMAGMPRHKVMLDYVRHLFTVYKIKPKFIFGFHGELSHDSYNLVGAMDNDLAQWLEWFDVNGHLNNTLLILMSDHGHRFAEIRNTQQGKLEERLPFFSFTFPSWFKAKYPDAYNNLKTNARRLTVPFDIYETLRNVLKFEGSGQGSVDNRGISLFKGIPEERTCADADVESHWCSCLMWEKIDEKLQIIQRSAREFVDYINKYIQQYSDLCHTLELQTVLEAARLLPNKDVLAFRRTYDSDGFQPDLGGSTTLTKEVYQVKIRTIPGDGLFEYSCMYYIDKNEFKFKVEDVSRINRYGSDSSCIEHTQEQLRKYCYCKN